MQVAARARVFLWLCVLASLLSCALTTSFDSYDTNPGFAPAAFYVLEGAVSGLGAGAVTLVLNNTTRTLVPDGPFTLGKVPNASSYTIAVEEMPHDRTCVVENGTGTVMGADVANVLVKCSPNDATLQALVTSAGPISPAFAGTTLAYAVARIKVSLFPPPTTVTVTATVATVGATLAIAGGPAKSGQPSAPIPLHPGPNPIDITVTAADGATKTHYTIVVNGAESDYFKASNTRPGADFGFAVALSSDTLAVGSTRETSLATGVNGDQTGSGLKDVGAVYVFTRAGSTWAQQAYLKASNARANSLFGFALALSGDTLAVGAISESSNAVGVNGVQSDMSAFSAGAVYVFRRSGTTWSQEAYVKASNARASSQFGWSVALDVDTLAVGALSESSAATGVNGNQADTTAGGAGAVYVFARAGVTWTQEAYLKASNTRQSASFGTAVALSGNTLAAMAPTETSAAVGVGGNQADVSAPNAGAAYVFTRSGTTWSQEAYIKASNTAASARFGTSAALAGDTLVVGAPGESSAATGINGNQADRSAPFAGAAYVYRRSGTSWAQEAYVKASNTSAQAVFGSAVAVTGDVLVVGAFADGSADDRAGAAYAFTRSGATWSELRRLVSANPRGQAFFGWSVAISGNGVAVGARGESGAATGVNGDQSFSAAQFGSGAAYAF
jgi:hypothetical protein